MGNFPQKLHYDLPFALSMKYICLWAAIACMAGSLLASYSTIPVSYGLGMLFLLFADILWMSYRKKRKAVLVAGVLFLSLAGLLRMEMGEMAYQKLSHYMADTKGTFTLIVKEEPIYTRYGYTRTKAVLETVEYDGAPPATAKGTVWVYDEKPKDTYTIGSRIEVVGKMKALRRAHNPGKIDLESRDKSEGIIGKIYTQEGESVRWKEETSSFFFEQKALALRKEIEKVYASYVSDSRVPLLMTLLFGGHYEDIPQEIMDDFSTTGIIHILSVSGSHMALLFTFLYFLGRWLRLPLKLTGIAVVCLVLFYAGLSGFVPPVLRASLMGVFTVGGLFFEREGYALNGLGVAVLAMVLWNPYLVYDVSFQLSVGASAGILIFYTPLLRLCQRVPHIFNWMREGVAVATSAQVLTVPFVLYHFHVFPTYFLLANLVVTPLLEWVIIGGLLSLLVYLVFVPLAVGLLSVMDACLAGAVFLNHGMAKAPYASLFLGGLSFWGIVLYYEIILLFFLRGQMKVSFLIRSGGALVVGLTALALVYTGWSASDFVVRVPDLGREQGALIVSKNRKIIYDKGDDFSARTLPYEWESFLQYEGVFKADILILNVENMTKERDLPVSIPVKEIWVTGGDGVRIYKVLSNHPSVSPVKRGHYVCDTGMTMDTNGSSWLMKQEGGALYIAGERPIHDNVGKEPLLFVGGSMGFHRSLSLEDVWRLAPEKAAYLGYTKGSAGDITELREQGCEMAVIDEVGMTSFAFRRGHWEKE